LGKKGKSRHLKRKPAPRFWPIPRKEFVWTVKPKPGPHPISRCLPLALIVRDMLGFAKTLKEAKIILSQGKLMVDGKIRKSLYYPAGLMDVVSIPEIDESYRILPSEKGLILHKIGKNEASFKLCRIENKNIVKNGHVQLNLHDGRNVLVKVTDAKNPQEDVFETLNTLKISIPKQEIMEQIKLEKGAFALVVGGKNIGKCGKIVDIEEMPNRKRRSLLATIEDAKGNRFQTTLNFIFAVGETAPIISLPEVE
jgi:small subunit ribosomal protein S4e